MLMWFFFPVCFMPCVDYFPFVPWAIAGSGLLFTKWKFEEKLTHWKRLWCCEGLGAGGKGEDRGWDGWMASLTRWMWVWVNSGSWCWTGRPGVLWFMGLQRVGHYWATELNWTEWSSGFPHFLQFKSEFGNKEFMIWATVLIKFPYYSKWSADSMLSPSKSQGCF